MDRNSKNFSPGVLGLLVLGGVLLGGYAAPASAASQPIHNDTVWRDTSGNPLYAQGGSMLKAGGVYYWFGADLSGGTGFVAIKVYRSTDLSHWEFVGNAATPATAGLGSASWVGRPDVLYNESTGKYVMWIEWNGNCNCTRPQPGNLAAVLTSSAVAGPYTMTAKGPFFLYGTKSIGDHALFKDTDGRAYLVYVGNSSVERNVNLSLARLNSSYTDAEADVFVGFAGSKREAPFILKRGTTYYWFTSRTSGWYSSETKYATATALTSWSGLNLLATEPASTDSFDTQFDFVIPVQGSGTTSYIYAGDRYSQFTGTGIGKNAWYPLVFNGATPVLKYYKDWYIDAVTGSWSASPGSAPVVKNPGFEEGTTNNAPTGWSIWAGSAGVDGNAVYVEPSGGHTGSKLTFWKSSAYEASLYQKVPVADGIYDVSAWVKSSGGQTAAHMYVKGYGGTEMDYTLPVTGTWTRITILNVHATSGLIEIGFYTKAGAGNWMNVDDVSISP